METMERSLKEKMAIFEEKTEKNIDDREKTVTNKMNASVLEKISLNTSQLKSWAEKKIDDKIIVSEKKEDKKIKECKDMFNVPMFIGPSNCTYANFNDYVLKMVAMSENFI